MQEDNQQNNSEFNDINLKIHFTNANAGSGKTTFLVKKAKEHIGNGDASNLLCLTFSNAGANEMLERIKVQIETERGSSLVSKPADQFQRDEIKVGIREDFAQTIHGFCFKLLQECNPNYKIMNGEIKKKLWEIALETFLKSEDDDVRKYDLSKLKEYTKKSYTGELGEIQNKIKEIFNNLKQKECWLDFDDMLDHAKKVLMSDLWSEHVKKIIGKINCVIVDEAQDLSNQQWEIVHIIIQELIQIHFVHVYVVGDTKQSIYGFQGANLDSLNTFKGFYKNMIHSNPESKNQYHEESFSHSYRCGGQVLGLVEKMFDVKHEALGGHSGAVQFWSLEDKSVCFQKILIEIQNLLKKGIKKADIMILIRKRNEKYKELAELLNSNGVETVYQSKDHLSELMLALLKLEYTNNDEVKEYCYLRLLKNELVPVDIVVDKKDKMSNLVEQNSFLQNLFSKLKKVDADPLKYVQTVLLEFSVNADLIDHILLKLNKYLLEGEYNFKQAYNFFKDSGDLSADLIRDVVSIQTVHSSKGMEREVVFLCDTTQNPFLGNNTYTLNDKILHDKEHENFDEMLNESQNKLLQEHYRLLYVGMTRAKNYLFIVNEDGKISEYSWYEFIKKHI